MKEDSGEKSSDGQQKLPQNILCQHANIPNSSKSNHTFFTLRREKMGTRHLPPLSHVHFEWKSFQHQSSCDIKKKISGIIKFQAIFFKQGSRKLILLDLPFAWILLSCTLEHWDFSGGIHSILTGIKSGICAFLASLEGSDPKGCDSELWFRTFSAEQEKPTFTGKHCFHGWFPRKMVNAEFGAGMEAKPSCGLKSPSHKLITLSLLGFRTSRAHRNSPRAHSWSLSCRMGEVRWASVCWSLSQRHKVKLNKM